jgi:DNA polymerase-3 subunit delta'
MNHPWLRDVESEFAERIAAGRMAHALLLSGPAETGKVELARAFLAGVLCLEGSYPACGQCRSCQLAETGAHPDGHVVTFEEHPNNPGVMRKELVVDQVRRLTASLFLTNTISRCKAALVFPVEAMNVSAANALLKTLEEPPGETVIILVSHNPARLPATIRSRCQALVVRLPQPRVALEWLGEQLPGTRQAQLEQALEAAGGIPLRARRMLEDGGVAQYAELETLLDGLLDHRETTAQATAAVIDFDPDRFWSWVSLRAAAETRASQGTEPRARQAAMLQALADRNRVLAHTPLRKELLIQDWLIQWAQLKR